MDKQGKGRNKGGGKKKAPPKHGTSRTPTTDLRQQSLKPLLPVGAAVYSAFWTPSEDRSADPTAWYPGVIAGRRTAPAVNIHVGPVVYYDVHFDDGDELDAVPDHFVMGAEEYELNLRHEDDPHHEWKGVRNVTDPTSRDRWARDVGWYVAALPSSNDSSTSSAKEGEAHTFSLLSDALRAHDAAVVRRHGVKTKAAELNLPEDWVEFVSGVRAVKHRARTKALEEAGREHKAALREARREGIEEGINDENERHEKEMEGLRRRLEDEKDVAVREAVQAERRRVREEESQWRKEAKRKHDQELEAVREEMTRTHDQKVEVLVEVLRGQWEQEKEALREEWAEKLNQQQWQQGSLETKRESLKPKLEVGEEVYAAWWPDRTRADEASWFPGRVKSYREVKVGGEEAGDGDKKKANVDGNDRNEMEEEATMSTGNANTDESDQNEAGPSSIPTEGAPTLPSSHPTTPRVRTIRGIPCPAEPCPEVGEGWTLCRVPREGRADKKDRYYFSPRGEQFNSLVAARRHRGGGKGSDGEGRAVESTTPAEALSDHGGEGEDHNDSIEGIDPQGKKESTIPTEDAPTKPSRHPTTSSVAWPRVIHGVTCTGAPCPEVGAGWTVTRVPRKGRKGLHKYYFAPDGTMFNSLVAARRHLETVVPPPQSGKCAVRESGQIGRDDRYGPTRLYTIKYDDDGTEMVDVPEQFVFPKSDYLLSIDRPSDSEWKGVRNVVDEASDSKWASMVGWYVASIVCDEGEEGMPEEGAKEVPFSRLTDALRAYDASIVRRKGDKTKRTELNLPEEWEWLFARGGIENPRMYSEEELNEAVKEVARKENEKVHQKLEKKFAKDMERAIDKAVAGAVLAERKLKDAKLKEAKTKYEKAKLKAVDEAVQRAVKLKDAKLKEAKTKYEKAKSKAVDEAVQRAVKEAVHIERKAKESKIAGMRTVFERAKAAAVAEAREEAKQLAEEELPEAVDDAVRAATSRVRREMLEEAQRNQSLEQDVVHNMQMDKLRGDLRREKEEALRRQRVELEEQHRRELKGLRAKLAPTMTMDKRETIQRERSKYERAKAAAIERAAAAAREEALRQAEEELREELKGMRAKLAPTMMMDKREVIQKERSKYEQPKAVAIERAAVAAREEALRQAEEELQERVRVELELRAELARRTMKKREIIRPNSVNLEPGRYDAVSLKLQGETIRPSWEPLRYIQGLDRKRPAAESLATKGAETSETDSQGRPKKRARVSHFDENDDQVPTNHQMQSLRTSLRENSAEGEDIWCVPCKAARTNDESRTENKDQHLSEHDRLTPPNLCAKVSQGIDGVYAQQMKEVVAGAVSLANTPEHRQETEHENLPQASQMPMPFLGPQQQHPHSRRAETSAGQASGETTNEDKNCNHQLAVDALLVAAEKLK